MQYYMPTKLYQEKDAVKKHAQEWCALGTKALIVTGRSSAKKNGALFDVCDSLTKQGKTYVIFDEIEENPSVDMVVAASRKGISEEADFVIGIGGGSPLDAAKAIAFLMYYPEDDAMSLYQAGKNGALPVVAIPTTCGTGSEVTPYSILTRKDLNSKGSIPHKIFPAFALVDGAYLAFAPKQVLYNTAVDALGHCIESYVNTNATEYSRMFVEKSLKIWAKSKEVFEGKRAAERSDYENMLLASSLAGMAITLTGTSLPHGLSYPLTCHLGLAHGAGVGYFQAGYLREADQKTCEELLGLAGFSSLEELDMLIHKLCRFETISEEMLLLCANEILSNETKLKNCPFPVDREKMLRIVGLE